MDNNKIQLIGAPCGYHGPYTFFKAFKYYRNGKHKILSLSDFFFVKLWSDLDLMSIGEVQLLWMDKNSEQVLASLRLYFLPENTPDGRNDDHGEDEVLAISEKVVLRVEDLLDRIIEDTDWCHGLTAVWDNTSSSKDQPSKPQMLLESSFDFDDIIKEKQLLGESRPDNASAVIVLSFPRYCRYRGIMKRIEGVTNKWSRHELVVALGGFAVPCKQTRVVFCKDTFDYPDLEGLELLCNHLAPNLKGRPRRKRKKRSLSPGGSDSNESESSLSTVSVSSIVTKIKPQAANRNGIRCNNLKQPRRSNRVSASVEEKDFLVKLHAFMRSKQTPIGRLPDVGFKELDLFGVYKLVRKLGGYGQVTANRMWKLIYDQMDGDSTRNSAATYLRRQYEKYVLPYEVHIHGTKPAVVANVDASPNHTDIKNVVPMGGKMSALRCVRPRGDKSTLDPVGVLPPDKENIPMSNLRRLEEAGQSSAEPEPELIDITDQDSPAKIIKTGLPTLKKRRLEILKEGGLEVTAVSAAIPEASVTITSERRPSVIQHASPVQRSDSQISITVTPDVSHMLDMLPSSSHRPQSFAWDPHRVTQSRSIYAHSEATVYGNPKDGLGRRPTKPTQSANEVLDLRVNSAPKRTSLPMLDGRTLLGSNLEITVVDVQQRRHSQQRKSQPRRNNVVDLQQALATNGRSMPRESNSHGHSSSRDSNNHVRSTSRETNSHSHFPSRDSNSHTRSTSRDSNSHGRSTSRETNSRSASRTSMSASYIPQLDSRAKSNTLPYSMYYPAMYNSQMYSYLPTMQGQQAPPPIFAPTAEHLQLYKDLMMMQAQQNSSTAAGFLGLPRDGSTSITPVNQHTTPTSK